MRYLAWLCIMLASTGCSDRAAVGDAGGGDSDAAGIDAGGVDSGDLDSARPDATGLDASGMDASGTDSGVDATGVDATGVDATGTDAGGADAAGCPADILGSVGLPCSSEGLVCTDCADPCGACDSIMCSGGRWALSGAADRPAVPIFPCDAGSPADGGLVEGEMCDPSFSLCGPGLSCCYPCGIPGCDFICEPTCAPGEPGCFDGCFLRP